MFSYENLVPTPSVVFGDLLPMPGGAQQPPRLLLRHRLATKLIPSPLSAVQDGCVVSREFTPHVIRADV